MARYPLQVQKTYRLPLDATLAETTGLGLAPADAMEARLIFRPIVKPATARTDTAIAIWCLILARRPVRRCVTSSPSGAIGQTEVDGGTKNLPLVGSAPLAPPRHHSPPAHL